MICVVTTIAAGEHIPDALHELIRGLFDLAKIGFGARTGMHDFVQPLYRM